MPSKVTSYKESTIAIFPIILSLLEKGDLAPSELYEKVKKSNALNINELVEIIDCLYAMHKVEINGEVLHYAG